MSHNLMSARSSSDLTHNPDIWITNQTQYRRLEKCKFWISCVAFEFITSTSVSHSQNGILGHSLANCKSCSESFGFCFIYLNRPIIRVLLYMALSPRWLRSPLNPNKHKKRPHSSHSSLMGCHPKVSDLHINQTKRSFAGIQSQNNP